MRDQSNAPIGWSSKAQPRNRTSPKLATESSEPSLSEGASAITSADERSGWGAPLAIGWTVENERPVVFCLTSDSVKLDVPFQVTLAVMTSPGRMPMRCLALPSPKVM